MNDPRVAETASICTKKGGLVVRACATTSATCFTVVLPLIACSGTPTPAPPTVVVGACGAAVKVANATGNDAYVSSAGIPCGSRVVVVAIGVVVVVVVGVIVVVVGVVAVVVVVVVG